MLLNLARSPSSPLGKRALGVSAIREREERGKERETGLDLKLAGCQAGVG